MIDGRTPNSMPEGDPLRDADTGARIPDELVDAFFDRELPINESSRLFSSLRNDPAKAREIVGTQRALSALRQPVKTPDFSAKVLAEVGRQKGWLSSQQRRSISFGRVATAAALLLMVGGAFALQRVAPQFTASGTAPAPIHELSAAVPAETAGASRNVAAAISDVITVSIAPEAPRAAMISIAAHSPAPAPAFDACADISHASLSPAPPATISAFCRVVCTTAHTTAGSEPRKIVGRATAAFNTAGRDQRIHSFVVPVSFPGNQPLGDDTLHFLPER